MAAVQNWAIRLLIVDANRRDSRFARRNEEDPVVVQADWAGYKADVFRQVFPAKASVFIRRFV